MADSQPLFITFTGADDATSVDGMVALAARYPIEWAILFSPNRSGVKPRYPSMAFVESLRGRGLRLAAHLCGQHSADLVAGKRLLEIEPLLAGLFQRVQVNTRDPAIDPHAIAAWAAPLGLTPILQCMDDFPVDTRVSWLFDPSAGFGKRPEHWPVPDPAISGPVGYAGGINPANVADTVAAIDPRTPYWIDMETGVRTDEVFDLVLCERVCAAVYGDRR